MSKTNFAKRILSLFLSLMMIVTSIPYFAITASAAEPSESGLVGSYFTKNITDGIKADSPKGTISWDSSVGAAKFDGSGYLVLEGKPMEAVNSSTGFTISLDVMRTSNSQPMQRLLDFNNGGETSTFALNGGSDGNVERYITLATPNATELRYWLGADLNGNAHATNTNYCSKTQAYDFLAQEKPGTWYNITITMEPSGSYSYYIDGELFVTYKPEYYSAKGSDVTPEKIMNSFSGFTNYMVGKAIYNDPAFTGYIKNLKLYDRAVDITSAIAGGGATNIEVLGNAMREFESRMDGSVYQNMGTAYDAYVAASKAYDAAYYGGDNSYDAQNAVLTTARNLTQAMLGMHKTSLKPYTANNPRPAFSSGTVNDGTFSNLVYSNKSNSGGSAVEFTITDSNVVAQIGYNEMVFLYDSKDAVLKAPVMFRAYKTHTSRTRSRYVYSVYPTTGSGDTGDHPDWELVDMWYTNGGKDFNFQNEYGKTSGRVGHNLKTRNAGKEFRSILATDWCSYANVLKFKNSTSWGNNEYIKQYKNLNWNVYAGGGNVSTDLHSTGAVNDNASIYVINYLPLKNAINADANKAVRSKVASYKEGGLSTYLAGCVLAANLNPNNYSYSTDLAGQVSQCASDIGTAITNFTASTTPDVSSNYPELRNAFDYSGTLANFNDGVTYSVREAYNGGVRKGFSQASYETFAQKYVAAQNVMKAVRTSGYLNDGIAGKAAKELKEAFNALEPVNVKAPTLTESTVLGPNDTIIIKNNETSGTVKYTIAYDGGAASAETVYSAPIKVFNGSTSYKTAVVTAYCTVGTDDSTSVSQTYTFYKAPAIDANEGDLLTQGQTVAITSNNATKGKIQYSYDNSNWKDYTGPVAPFTENKTTTANLYAREVCGNATSATVSVLNFVKRATFNILSSTGDNSFDSASTFTISDISGYEDGEIRYEINIDGTSTIGPNVYNKDTGIVVSGNGFLTSAKLITITAYANSQAGTDQKVTAKFFNSDNYNPLAYRESFDDAKISGTTFTTGSNNKFGSNGTLKNSGQNTIEKGAGYKDGAGNSPDWRENVLKVNTATEKPGNMIELAKNPLADNGVNASAAQSSGATITFWRHIEDANGNTVSETDNWIGGITFQETGATGWARPYFLISTTGYVTYHNSDDSIYGDINPSEQGVTKHSVGNKSGHWVQVAVTIDPNSGVKVYTNGELHDSSVNTDPAYAQAVLQYITSTDAHLYIANSLDSYNKNNYFFDDIRIYSTAMTQTEINNMYVDKYADVQKQSATGHDPSTVAVYTLTNGDKVGENYIVKNNAYNQVASVEYYMFGTGMTIYHSTDAEHWELIGDSQGRCNYQNEDLFGGPYTTALAEPLNFAAGDTNNVQYGAGNLVWAPHVMYNVGINKWCYYGSTSSWGSGRSAIFLCTSDNITGPYTYKGIVVNSTNGSPNAIDPVVFYDKDFSKLYMIYGSWGGESAIKYINLNATGQNLGDGKSGVVCYGINTGLEPNSTDGGSGEGAYVTYNNGYYYLYVSYGQNYGTYTTRVFRSTNPVSGYVDIDGTSALDNTTSTMHGNQFMHSFDLPIYDYAYNSTGHNSVFITQNVLTGEKITLNTTHARPWSTSSRGMKAIEDTALSTRQGGAKSEFNLSGNVTLVNQIGYTKSGWPVAMPYQYSSNDTVRPDYTSTDIQGTYNFQGFGVNVNADLLGYSEVTFTATGDYTGIIHYGTTAYDYVISKAEDGTTLINVYDNAGIIYEGVIGTHDDNRRREVPQMGFVNVRTGENSWAYMTSQDQNISCSEQYNVTFENLFSFDKFVNSGSASATTSNGTASYDAANRTITVTGSGDNYTNHANLPTVYKIPVTPGKTYYLDFTADNINADAMIFVPNADETSFDGEYVGFRGGHVNGQNRIEITVPDGKNYVYFRFGSTVADNVTVNFSNIVFYEASRADYRGSMGSEEIKPTCGHAYGTLPTPTRIGYVFDGWYSDTDYNYPVTAETIAVHSPNAQSLYAKWIVCTHTDTRVDDYVAPTCTENGSTGTTICNICGATVTEASVIPALGHNYIANESTNRFVCSICNDIKKDGGNEIDLSAYYSQVALANSKLANTAKYTEDSLNALQAELNKVENKLDPATDTQSTVDAKAKAIGEAITNLDLKSYTVTFIVMKGDTQQSNNQIPYNYGDVAELEVTDANSTVYKWVASDGKERKIAGATNRVSHYVTGNITIYAHIDDSKPVTDDTQYLVRVFNRVNKVVGYMYVAKDSQLTFESSTVTVGNASVTIEKTPFYQIDGYTVNGKQIKSGMPVTSNIDVHPIYTAHGEIEITLDKTNNSNIKFSTSDEDRIKPLWDHKITVVTTDSSDVTWYVNDEPVAYGSSYTFRATQSMTIKAVKDATEKGSSTITYYAYEKDNNKARVTVSTYKSDNFVISEQGILVLTSKTENAPFNYDDFKTNGIKFVAKKTTDTGDQFSYSLNVGSSGIKTIGVVSYVVYENGKTVYSKDHKTINVR